MKSDSLTLQMRLLSERHIIITFTCHSSDERVKEQKIKYFAKIVRFKFVKCPKHTPVTILALLISIRVFELGIKKSVIFNDTFPLNKCHY